MTTLLGGAGEALYESTYDGSSTDITPDPSDTQSISSLPASASTPAIDSCPNSRKVKSNVLAIRPPAVNELASQHILDPAPRTGVSLAASLSEILNPSSPGSGAGSKNKIGEGNDTTVQIKDNSDSLTQRLSALSNSQANATGRDEPTPRLPLKSPCYFHQRFDNAVNIERVLDEVVSDEWMSHSRLMQTATGVREVSRQLQRRPIKLAVRNVMIVTKARDNSLVYLTRDLAQWLLSTPRYGSDLGVNVYVDAKLRQSKRFDAHGLLEMEPRFEHMLKYWTPDLCWSHPEKFDLVITLGGDGTVLFTSWLFQRVVPPILSFSLGSLGFLTNFEFSKYKEHLNQIMGDLGMRVNLRMRFTCTVYRANAKNGNKAAPAEEVERFEVVNELVIDRGPSPYVSNLEVYGDDELLTVVQADGCIFSTPTGSTAYSLSAGGSLIHPSIPAILLTPICPHTLSFRPMVLSDTLLLRVAVPRHSRSSAYCSFDGKGRIKLRRGDYVTVEASQYPFPTVVSQGGEWFESVRRSLRWNVRGAVQKGWNGSADCPDGEVNTIPPTADMTADPGTYDDDDEEDEDWDIDTDTVTDTGQGTDSGLGQSECGDSPATGSSSPIHRVMSLLNI
ncbi:ferric reductase [Arthroderma uncinatum]|uniref:ferric reductase n=1 Tax=Arthroderma uncinatum TaxID=74035 RepID=UPI00144AC890|nr:ferric reductase [Arthroderma uncinatum]KAF3491079.1 ferric reductase [Arthroderma uncinatum]